jgi:hypothetical protein
MKTWFFAIALLSVSGVASASKIIATGGVTTIEGNAGVGISLGNTWEFYYARQHFALE